MTVYAGIWIADTMSHKPDDLDIDRPPPDDHEWGREWLDQILEEFGFGSAADENLLGDVRGAAARWQLPPPQWVRRDLGWYELKAPRGLLGSMMRPSTKLNARAYASSESASTRARLPSQLSISNGASQPKRLDILPCGRKPTRDGGPCPSWGSAFFPGG
jgi:hypothetical protein